MSQSGVPIISQLAGLTTNGATPPTPVAPPAAPTLTSAGVAEAANEETMEEGQGQAADILTGGGYKGSPNVPTARSILGGK